MVQYLQKVLISMFLIATSCKLLEATNYIPEIPADDLIRNYDGDNCTLPCVVQANDSLHTPRVSWYFYEQHGYIALNDKIYWKEKNETTHCHLAGDIDYYNFSRPSRFDCKAEQIVSESKSVYDCSQVLDRCYYGWYQCRVSTSVADTEVVVVKKVTVRSPMFIIREPPVFRCFYPTASNISAGLIHPGNSNDDITWMNVTWLSSKQPANASCVMTVCPVMRKYKVKMMVFNSAPYDSGVQPDYETGWLRPESKESNNLIISSISVEKYYKFQVKNKRHSRFSRFYATAPVTIPPRETSRLFYFGEQELDSAHLTEPAQDETYSVAYGDSITIKCAASGKPSPKITLSHLENGQKQIYRESTSAIVLELIVTSSKELHCTASNYFLNSLGELKHSTSTRSITINMLPDVRK